MSSNPTLQIPRDVIEPIIQAHVTEAVLNALGGQNELVKPERKLSMPLASTSVTREEWKETHLKRGMPIRKFQRI